MTITATVYSPALLIVQAKNAVDAC